MNMQSLNLYDRLDIFVKILYIKHFVEKSKDFEFYKNLYQKHIKLYNWCIEDHKKSINNFEKDFQNLIKNIQNNWFDPSYPIFIGQSWEILSGAHRLACCMYFWLDPFFDIQEGEWISWGYEWFQDNNFEEVELAEILWCYTDYNKDFFIYVLWPWLVEYEKEIIWDLSYYWVYIWWYSLGFNKTIIHELVKDLYSYEVWNISWWFGLNTKIIHFEKYKNKSIKILVFHATQPIERSIKDDLPLHYKCYIWISDWTETFYTFHSWESQKENNYIKEILLSKDNIQSYYYRTIIDDKDKFISRIIELRQYMFENNIDITDICIVWSSVLAIYWLRDAKDLDLIWYDVNTWNIQKINKNIEKFNYEYSAIISNEDIISKKENYLYFRWFKYIHPKLFIRIKESLYREKDIFDYKLLQNMYIHDKSVALKKICLEVKFFKKKYRTLFVIWWINITKKLWIYRAVSYFRRKFILKNL